jgi:hypothetical protein
MKRESGDLPEAGMREPSGEGESCWLFGTLRLVGSLVKSCLPFVSSRFPILNPEYSQSWVRKSYRLELMSKVQDYEKTVR